MTINLSFLIFHFTFLSSQQWGDNKLPDIIRIDIDHQCNDDGHADVLCTLLSLIADRATDDGFDQEDEDMTTVEAWDWQDVHEGQCD